MITVDEVTFTYPGCASPALAQVSLTIEPADVTLLIGATGSGKSTLLRLLNGHAPHLTGGHLVGSVRVHGRDTRTHPPRDLADLIGVVPQDPRTCFVTDRLEDECAYAMEQQGIPPATMRRRVAEVLDLLSLTELRHRRLSTLSGGQRQRVAIAAALTSGPRILLLDEPTSALDPGAAEEVLAAIRRLTDDLGITVVIAEHRLERVLGYADAVIAVDSPHRLRAGPTAHVLADTDLVPPVVHLGRWAGWQPPPLTVREARRHAAGLAERLADSAPPAPTGAAGASGEAVTVDRVGVRYGTTTALHGVTLGIRPGEVVALMGRNGSGKTTLLSAVVGLRRPDEGTLSVAGLDPARLRGRALISRVGLVPQEPADLLIAGTVERECALSDVDAQRPPGHTRALLDSLTPGINPTSHPRDLSEGQRLCCALAVILAGDPAVILLDEPTRGLDYRAKARLVAILRRLAAENRAILLATHDVELAAEVATRLVILADGEVLADGPAADVLASSPMFAPQVAKVLAPLPWLTVTQVQMALDA